MGHEQLEISHPLPEHEAGLRVSDRERERVVELLAEHAAEGRLTLEELDARTEGAHTARTRSGLAALMADLPASGRSGTTASRVAPAPRSRPSRQRVAFVAGNLVLVAVWALSGGGYFWPIWPILGWGLGLVKGGPCAHGRARGLASGEPARRLTRATDAG